MTAQPTTDQEYIDQHGRCPRCLILYGNRHATACLHQGFVGGESTPSVDADFPPPALVAAAGLGAIVSDLGVTTLTPTDWAMVTLALEARASTFDHLGDRDLGDEYRELARKVRSTR